MPAGNRINNLVFSNPPRPQQFDVTGISIGGFEANGTITAGSIAFRIDDGQGGFTTLQYFSFTANAKKAGLTAPFSGSERGAFDLGGHTALRIVCSPDFAGTVDISLSMHAAPTPDPTVAVS
jgi:hypothetical protein